MIWLPGKRRMGITSLVFASHSTLGRRTEPVALFSSFCCNSNETVLALTFEVCPHSQDGPPLHEIGGSRTYTVGPNFLVLRFGLCGLSHCTPSWITSPCFHMKCRLGFWEGRTEREKVGWVWVSEPILLVLCICYWLITVTTTLSCIQLILVTDLTGVWLCYVSAIPHTRLWRRHALVGSLPSPSTWHISV